MTHEKTLTIHEGRPLTADDLNGWSVVGGWPLRKDMYGTGSRRDQPLCLVLRKNA